MTTHLDRELSKNSENLHIQGVPYEFITLIQKENH